MDTLHLNGIDARTGAPLVPPLDLDELAARLRADLPAAPTLPPAPVVRGLPYGIEPADPTAAGWAVVVPAGQAERADALAPLISHRAEALGAAIKVLDVRPDEPVRAWLARHGVGPVDVDPERVPYYLLLLADPTEVSFAFQSTLAIRYCVGRLALAPPELAAYARSVVAAERRPPARRRHVSYWAPRHDPATTLSAEQLVAPLHAGTPGRGATGTPPHLHARATSSLHLAGEATRARLLDLLHGRHDDRPALLFTASHGLGLAPDDPRQAADQGALLTHEWSGLRPPERARHLVAADHIADDADVHGLFAFLFACFGAGTPATDEFQPLTAAPRTLAPRPFVSALPQRLLTHPGGGALAVVGHVERAWGFSFHSPGVGPQIVPFYNFVAALLRGEPVAHALRGFPERNAVHSADLVDDRRADLPPRTLVQRFTERNDARNYVVLGDPAARLPRA
jgi:hypothetical protein